MQIALTFSLSSLLFVKRDGRLKSPMRGCSVTPISGQMSFPVTDLLLLLLLLFIHIYSILVPEKCAIRLIGQPPQGKCEELRKDKEEFGGDRLSFSIIFQHAFA